MRGEGVIPTGISSGRACTPGAPHVTTRNTALVEPQDRRAYAALIM